MKTRNLSLLLFLLCAFTVRAADVVNNTANASAGELPSTNVSMAQAFDTGSVATRLSSITVRLRNSTGTSKASVQLWSGDGLVPVTLVESLGDTGGFTNSNEDDYTINSPTHPMLAANTRYWVVVVSTSSGEFGWRNCFGTVAATDAGATLKNERAFNGGSGWAPFPFDKVQIMSVSSATIVTNTNDSGAGSLRQVLADAAAQAGPDTIVFNPATMNGATIALSTFSNPGGLGNTALLLNSDVTIDASALPNGLTIKGAATNFRIFYVPSGSSLTLIGLSVKDGGGVSFDSGGAILNDGTLSLTRCTLTGNQALGGGAIYNDGTATLLNCTLSANTAPSAAVGGAICNADTLALTHCTLSGNTATNGGGVYALSGTLTLTNSIIAGNTATGAGGTGADIAIDANGAVTRQGANIVQSLTNSGGTLNGSGSILAAAASLAPLGNYGGPTQTMPPLLDSPAVDAATVLNPPLTADQRGFGVADGDGNGSSQPDIGAVELQVRLVTTPADENDGLTTGGVSLREALADNSGQSDIVRFDPAVFNAVAPATNTLSLGGTAGGSAIIVSNRVVSVDARDIPAGVTIDDGAATSYGLFRVASGTNLAFYGLTLANGGGPDYGLLGNGGAIVVETGGTVALTRCTLSGNQAFNGGAMQIIGGGKATLTHCTLADNHAAGNTGGAIFSASTLTLTHCTVSGNSADASGGGIGLTGGTLTLTNNIISGNTATSLGPDIRYDGVNGSITRTGKNFIGDPADSNLNTGPGSGILTTAQDGDVKLDPAGLAAHGGPTKTIALLTNSPAIDAANGSTATKDQRGFPKFVIPDLGAYERQLGSIVDPSTNEDTATGGFIFFVGQIGTLSGSCSTALASPSGIVFDGGGAQRNVTITPAPDANGTATITITDSLSGETLTCLLTVAAVNDPPRFNEGTSQILFADSGPHTVPGWAIGIAAGPANETGTLTFHVTNDNNALFSTQPAVASDGTLTFTPATGARGFATVSVKLSDDGSNVAPNVNTSAVQTFTIDVRPVSPESAKVVFASPGATGDPAPDAGVNGIPGGPATGSKLTSLGVPCVDDLGNLSYLAKWQSSPKDKSSGLFYRDAVTGSTNCLLGLGGAAAPVANATVKSLADPVGSAGHVAMLGTIKVGTKTLPAVFSNAAGGRTPLVIAQAGDSATADQAKFQSFKAVEVAGDYVAVFAQLTTGTGTTPKTTAANDLGIWVKDGNGPLTPVLREGQEVAPGKTIKTLVAFLPGNGSPGQGRGWLREQTAPEGAIALALCLFTDKTQGLVTVDLATPNNPVLVTRSELIGIGGPFVTGVANPAFASFGVPARNGAGDFAFLASLKPDMTNGVTKANASAVFAGPTVGGYYGAVARVNEGAPGTNGNFTQFKDVALGEDGTFAFPATIKGAAVKASETNTLWWQPAGKAFQLLAQSDRKAGIDVSSDVHWKSFGSLAVPGGYRGPIFAATLIPNKTGVNAANANGVWGVDFTGAIRTLFRANVTQIDVGTPGMPVLKTVANFTLLKATPGSTGVTRSFNDAAKVVWLATFTDKTTAIVTTEVP